MKEHPADDYRPPPPGAPPGGSPPRFTADCMLGKLAKWLRILGYDTLYDPSATDDRIVRISVAEDRVILTRDTRLVLRRAARRHLLIASAHPPDQLRQVVEALGLAVEEGRIFSRCLPCNAPLGPIPRREVEGRVPPYVFETQRRFARCDGCGRIYWEATHRAGMRRRLERILGRSAGPPSP